jgi:hypothetical protein
VPLFRVEARPGANDGLLGYQWIEVLAIEPKALAERTRGYGDWANRLIVCDYICLTEMGLMTIRSDDFWSAMEEHQEYDEQTPQQHLPGIVITAGDASVIMTGGKMRDAKAQVKEKRQPL